MSDVPAALRRPRLTAAVGGLLLLPAAVSGCSAQQLSTATGSEDAEKSSGPVTIQSNVRATKDVAVDTLVTVRAGNGDLDKVTVSSPQGMVTGKLSDDGAVWEASQRLEPGLTYTVNGTATSSDGDQKKLRQRFTTQELSLDQQTYPSVAPLQGETVGVGMPVVLTFDVPVTDRKAFEQKMTVTSQPAQPGSWHWMSDTEVHWRPQSYWKPGTKVSVDADLNSVPAGGGVYGQESKKVSFTVGESHIYKVDAAAHRMKVFSGGRLLRTIPITTGKPGFTTRSGTKVIMEKFDSKRMNSETVGIDPNSSDGYDINNVQWAMRVTSSGEFLHAAPWSVGSQGVANVSHGCTGMSTDNAGWLYAMTRRGDVVEYTGTDRPMTLDNGYGDWNVPFAEYRKGSALRS